jgi:hypothetical protein
MKIAPLFPSALLIGVSPDWPRFGDDRGPPRSKRQVYGCAAIVRSPGAIAFHHQCRRYLNPSMSVLAEVLHLNPGGSYTTRGGGNTAGRYASQNGKIQFTSGPIAGATASMDGSTLRLLPPQGRERSGKFSSLVCSPVR